MSSLPQSQDNCLLGLDIIVSMSRDCMSRVVLLVHVTYSSSNLIGLASLGTWRRRFWAATKK